MADDPEMVMPAPQFPFEIWLKIASFLNREERWKLHSVSRTLFKICMDEKYRAVQLQSPEDIIRSMNLISTPAIACRVRHLDFWPHALAGLDATYNPTIQWESKGTQGQNTSNNTFYDGEDPLQDLVDLMNRFCNVNTLSLSSTRCLELPAFLQALPAVTVGWEAFGRSLRKLTLDVTLEGCWRILTPEMVFPNLEELSIKFSKAYLTTDTVLILSTLMGPFVNNHHASLRILILATQRHLDISPFLLSIQHLSRLARLSCSCVLSDEERQSEALHHVLSMHASTLQFLSLRFTNLNHVTRSDPVSEGWFTSDILSVDMPQLEGLDFRMETLPETPYLMGYLQHYESTLTSLILGYKKFTLEDVENITEVFKPSKQLRVLNCGVCCLRPALLDTLSKHLPNLEVLSLLMEFIGTDEPAERGNSESFENAMIGRSYPKWKLKHFRGVITSTPIGGTDAIERALRNSIPQLQIFQLQSGRG